jgi:hypothetical protein
MNLKKTTGIMARNNIIKNSSSKFRFMRIS